MTELETALRATGYDFAQYGWSRAPAGDYGVFAPERAEDFVAGGKHAERGTVWTVDLFTRDASQTPRDAIEAALNNLPGPWKLDSISYEDETGYIHYLWRCGVYG